MPQKWTPIGNSVDKFTGCRTLWNSRSCDSIYNNITVTGGQFSALSTFTCNTFKCRFSDVTYSSSRPGVH